MVNESARATPGDYNVVVYAHSVVSGTWIAQTTSMHVN